MPPAVYWAMAKRAPDSRGQIWPASSAFPRRPSPIARRYSARSACDSRGQGLVERLTGGVDGTGHVGLACFGDAEVRLLGRRIDDLDDVGGGGLDPLPADEEAVVVADRCGCLLDRHRWALRLLNVVVRELTREAHETRDVVASSAPQSQLVEACSGTCSELLSGAGDRLAADIVLGLYRGSASPSGVAQWQSKRLLTARL